MGVYLLSLLFGAFAMADTDLGNKVVFFGDSNTAANHYIEFLRSSVPNTNPVYINSGLGGDTTKNSLARLQRDVIDHNPDTVFVLFGVNDIGWGSKLDDATKKEFLDSQMVLVSKLRTLLPGARIIVGTYPTVGLTEDNSADLALQELGDEALLRVEKLGAVGVDVGRVTRKIKSNLAQLKNSRGYSLHQADGVHFTTLGHAAIAYAILYGLGASQAQMALVSSQFPDVLEIFRLN